MAIPSTPPQPLSSEELNERYLTFHPSSFGWPDFPSPPIEWPPPNPVENREAPKKLLSLVTSYNYNLHNPNAFQHIQVIILLGYPVCRSHSLGNASGCGLCDTGACVRLLMHRLGVYPIDVLVMDANLQPAAHDAHEHHALATDGLAEALLAMPCRAMVWCGERATTVMRDAIQKRGETLDLVGERYSLFEDMVFDRASGGGRQKIFTIPHPEALFAHGQRQQIAAAAKYDAMVSVFRAIYAEGGGMEGRGFVNFVMWLLRRRKKADGKHLLRREVIPEMADEVHTYITTHARPRKIGAASTNRKRGGGRRPDFNSNLESNVGFFFDCRGGV